MTPLHWIGDLIRAATMAVPLGVVRAVFVGLLIGLLVWVLRLPADRVQPPEGERSGWSGKLKWWAALALLLQALIYLLV